MPGDNTDMTVELINPIAMDESSIAIREGGTPWRRSSYGILNKQWPLLQGSAFFKAYDHDIVDQSTLRNRETVLRLSEYQRSCNPATALPIYSCWVTAQRQRLENISDADSKRLIDIVEPSEDGRFTSTPGITHRW